MLLNLIALRKSSLDRLFGAMEPILGKTYIQTCI